MTKAMDTINIHQLILKIHNTHIPTTIVKFLANYLKGRQQYTSYNNQTSKHTNIKAGAPQGGVLSPTLFNIYLSDLPFPKINSVNLITYADDITITSSHSNTNTATHNLFPYLNEIHTWAYNGNLQINPTLTTTILMTPDSSEYKKPLNIHINNTPIPTNSYPTVLGLPFDPKLKFSTHTDNIITKAKKSTQSPKTPHINTLEKKPHTKHYFFPSSNTPTPSGHPSSHPPPLTNFKNSKCSLENNHRLHPRHLHSETKILPLQNHLKLHASQPIQKAFHPTHPLHPLTTQEAHPRYKKQSTFNKINYTLNITPFQITSHTNKKQHEKNTQKNSS